MTGATTAIRPTASARYRLVMPMPAGDPGRPCSSRGPRTEAGSPRRSRARPSASDIPTTCEMNTTPKTGARRLARPPPKSPAPQDDRARSSPKTTAPVAPDRTSIRRSTLPPRPLRYLHGRRTGQLHDGVRRAVVPIRGGHVDDLEVRRDRLEQAERPLRRGHRRGVTNGSSISSGGRRSPVTSRTRPRRAVR